MENETGARGTPSDAGAFANARAYLRRFFGYDEFRPAQEPVVLDLLSGRDTVAIMPTGAGKSVCFQIPALSFAGLTLVISPLISLMKDQVDALAAQGVPATFINSTLSRAEADERLAAALSGSVRILYVAPERLEDASFAAVARTSVVFVAVDEAHCISQWGHDFRPSYRAIAPFIATLPRRPVVGAFTATATPEVRADIVRLLALRSPAVHVSGFDRPNLFFDVLRGEDKERFLLSYLRARPDESGIIYAATRKQVESLHALLKARGFSVGRYHAGLDNEERRATQEDFLYDRLSVIVATNAFGMGIDKSNVRYVIHYSIPKNLEAYYQEAGRAGRDGERGECILLYAASDVRTQQYLINHSVEDEARRVYENGLLLRMVDYCHTPGCLRRFIIDYFGGIAPETCGNCGNCRNNTELVDLTLDAQKAFSCIWRMEQRFGLAMVSQVLAGSDTQGVSRWGFERLSTFGLFKERSQKDIRLLLRRLAATGYLEVESEHSALRLTPMAAAVLKGEAKVLLRLPKAPVRREQVDTLFEALRKVRSRIAMEERIRPYIILSDATLWAMCRLRPKNPDELAQVRGVGERKLRRYGAAFLRAIRETPQE